MKKRDELEERLKKLIKEEVSSQVRDRLLSEYINMVEAYISEHQQTMKEVRDCLKVLTQSKIKVRKGSFSEAN